MKGYQKAIGIIIIIYIVGFVMFGIGRRYGILEGMESRVSAASCQQYVIEADMKYRQTEYFAQACMGLFFDKPVRGKR